MKYVSTNIQKRIVYFVSFLVLVLFIVFAELQPFFVFSLPDIVSMKAGNSYYVKLESFSRTDHWAGLMIKNNDFDMQETNEPFLTINISMPLVTVNYFPGKNLKDGFHYYAAMPISTSFNVNNVRNVSFSDLEKDGLFNKEYYPIFYDNYYAISDNPKATFSSGTYEVINISGIPFRGIAITLLPGTKMVLLKYFTGSTYVPLFLTEFKNQICASNNECVGQLMLPLSSREYSFYILSMLPAIDFKVWIDNVETNHFSQTALPYIVKVKAEYIYQDYAPARDIDVVIGETNGQNLFIPIRLSGYVSQYYTKGHTDSNGEETFLIAPTVYPNIENYSIFVARYYRNALVSKEKLFVDITDELTYKSKPLSPDSLYDNAKINVNEMNQIISFLYKWTSVLQQAYSFNVNYDISTDTLSVNSIPDFGGNLLFKTGAPNIVTFTVTYNGHQLSDYYVRVNEKGGYLIMNPYSSDYPLSKKEKYKGIIIPTGQSIVITPTARPASNSTITFEILDSNYNLLKTINATVNTDLNINMGGIFYSNDQLKMITNAMNQILSSLFYSLNY